MFTINKYYLGPEPAGGAAPGVDGAPVSTGFGTRDSGTEGPFGPLLGPLPDGTEGWLGMLAVS